MNTAKKVLLVGGGLFALLSTMTALNVSKSDIPSLLAVQLLISSTAGLATWAVSRKRKPDIPRDTSDGIDSSIAKGDSLPTLVEDGNVRKTHTTRASPLAIAATVVPVAIVIWGGIAAWNTQLRGNDWFGLERFLGAGIGLLAASITSLILAIASFARREPKAELSLLTAVPGAIFLFFSIVFVAYAIGDAYRR